jgi:hypothetical protein
VKLNNYLAWFFNINYEPESVKVKAENQGNALILAQEKSIGDAWRLMIQQKTKIAELEANQVKAEALIAALREQVFDCPHLDKQVELYFAQKNPCTHDFVCADNEKVVGAEICKKCHLVQVAELKDQG